MSTKTPIKTRTRTRPVAQTLAAIETTPVRVRATRAGFDGERRRRAGDVFVVQAPIKGGEAEIPSWCEPADRNTPLKETGAQAALNDATAEIRALQGGATPAATSNGDDLGI